MGKNCRFIEVGGRNSPPLARWALRSCTSRQYELRYIFAIAVLDSGQESPLWTDVSSLVGKAFF